ncbi:conserved hypothetical protein [Ricinus communis]|uniref:Uncharacterized protein n=1 Tax=Ricinus communis TaxID=3988 RepID=B9SZ47_RICCO|nr:conserved hypothetical protein [Ricinus communis]
MVGVGGGIGNGERINIWSDAWLKEIPGFRIASLGPYTVRSASRKVIDSISDEEQSLYAGDWRKLWSLEVPPNINFSHQSNCKVQRTLSELVCCLWGIWRQCNNWLRGHMFQSPAQVFSTCMALHAIWAEARLSDGVKDTYGQMSNTSTSRWYLPQAGWVKSKEAEALCFKEALSWVQQAQHSHIVFQLNAKTLVDAFNRSSSDIF